MSAKKAKYQIYAVSDIHNYEWNKKSIFKKRRTLKTGSFKFNPRWVVAESREKAIEIIKDRYVQAELGFQKKTRHIDTEFGIKDIHNSTLVSVEYEVIIPSSTFKELTEKLQHNDFLRLVKYYDLALTEVLKNWKED